RYPSAFSAIVLLGQCFPKETRSQGHTWWINLTREHAFTRSDIHQQATTGGHTHELCTPMSMRNGNKARFSRRSNQRLHQRSRIRLLHAAMKSTVDCACQTVASTDSVGDFKRLRENCPALR